MEKVGLILIGATGLVGQEILGMLAEESFEATQIQLSASDDSIGEFYNFGGKELEVVSSEKLDLEKPALVLLCTPRDISEKLLETLRAKDLIIVDCSGLERVPHNLQLMPEAHSGDFKGAAYSIKSAAGFMLSSFFHNLGIVDKVTSLTVTSLEPVSGAGRAGLDELWNQTRSIFSQTSVEPEFFPEQIAFNLLSQVDLMRADGVTAYEQKIAEELEACGVRPEKVSITSLRIPVMYGCGISLSFETAQAFEMADISKQFNKSARFSLDQDNEQPPSTMSAVGDDLVHIARFRFQPLEKGKGTLINCWLVADNIKACLARPVVDFYRSLMPVS